MTIPGVFKIWIYEFRNLSCGSVQASWPYGLARGSSGKDAHSEIRRESGSSRLWMRLALTGLSDKDKAELMSHTPGGGHWQKAIYNSPDGPHLKQRHCPSFILGWEEKFHHRPRERIRCFLQFLARHVRRYQRVRHFIKQLEANSKTDFCICLRTTYLQFSRTTIWWKPNQSISLLTSLSFLMILGY